MKHEFVTPGCPEEELAIQFMKQLLTLDPYERLTADQALDHDFLTRIEYDDQIDALKQAEQDTDSGRILMNVVKVENL